MFVSPINCDQLYLIADRCIAVQLIGSQILSYPDRSQNCDQDVHIICAQTGFFDYFYVFFFLLFIFEKAILVVLCCNSDKFGSQ